MPLGTLPPGPILPTAQDERYDIRIARDGTWFYHGSPIGRLPLVRLFSTVLRRDEVGDYWLITPAERGRIQVDDTPFIAVTVQADGTGLDQNLTFVTNVGDTVTAGPQHPLQVDIAADGQPHPTIVVRDRLLARLARPVFYQLVELAESVPTATGTRLEVVSNGVRFSLGELETC